MSVAASYEAPHRMSIQCEVGLKDGTFGQQRATVIHKRTNSTEEPRHVLLKREGQFQSPGAT